MAYLDLEKKKINDAKKKYKYYHKNLEVSRAKSRESKRKQRAKRKCEINERSRKRYATKRAEELGKIKARRIRANPFRGLTKAIRECGNSAHEINTIDRLLRGRLALCNEISSSTRRLGPDGR